MPEAMMDSTTYGAEVPHSAVFEGMERLDKVTTQLDKALMALSERLGHVCRPEDPQPDSADVRAVPGNVSPHAENLRSLADHLSTLNRRVERMANLLDL